MISASKYQRIIYFKSLLKVSLCINRPKQRLVCMDTRRGCRSKRSLTPWKNKKQFFFTVWWPFCYFFLWEGFMLRFSSYGRFFPLYGGLFATFSLRGGAFLLRLPPGVWLFSPCGGLFCYFFSICGDFCLHGGFYVFMGFFNGLAPSP